MKTHARAPVTLRCKICGEEFVWTPYNGFKPQTCSPRCRSELRSKRARERPKKPPRYETLVCEVCGTRFEVRVKHPFYRLKACSVACRTTLKKRGSGDRHGQRNPNYRNGKRVGVRDRAGEERWYTSMASYCQNPECGGQIHNLDHHHIVYRQAVVRAGGDVWDPRNGITLCSGCHPKQHNSTRWSLALTALPASAYAFASELLGPGAAYNYLRRRYAGDDPRLEALALPEMQ